MQRSLGVVIGFVLGLSGVTQADETQVEFNQADLAAVSQLVHPEKARIELDQKRFVVEPPPALRFFGLGGVNENLDLSWFGNIIGLRFEHLTTGPIQVYFDQGALVVRVPVMDNDYALRSLLGRVAFHGVTLTARIAWDGTASSDQRLSLAGIEFSGKLRGTGVLASSLVLGKTREFAIKQMEKSLRELISKPNVGAAIENGLLQYSKFYTGNEYREFLPETLSFYSENGASGVRYQVR